MTAPLRALAAACFALALTGPAQALTIQEIGDPGAPGEDGESVRASGSEVASGADPAAVLATAIGGPGGEAPPEGGAAGDGGRAGLGPLYAASDTGDVVVDGTAIGGPGGRAPSDAEAGDGASVRLFNRVDGDTAGALELSQIGWGGDGGLGHGGRAGAAASHLSRRKAAESFVLTSRAVGGGVPVSPSRSLSFTKGAPARARGRGVNSAGSMRTLVSAVGGTSASNFSFPGEDGGDASAVAYAHTLGDGQPVSVGVEELPGVVSCGTFGPSFPILNTDAGSLFMECPPSPGSPDVPAVPLASYVAPDLQRRALRPSPGLLTLFPGAGAFGGGGGGSLSILLPLPTPPAGDGGDAHSSSVGIADGDSAVEVLDVARGGSGGFQVGVESGGPSRGGKARSVGVGVGGGASPVSVEAHATGGSAGSVGSVGRDAGTPFFPPEAGLPGGAAQASAVAIGRGEVRAQAFASGGDGTGSSAADPRHPGGPGSSVARAIGAYGEASAAAKSSSEALRVEVRALASVRRSVTTEARIGPADCSHPGHGPFRRLSHYFSGRDASVEATVAPDGQQVEQALRREPGLRQALEDAGVETIDALGTFSAWKHRLARARGSASQPSHTTAEPVSALEIDLSSLPLIFFGSTDPVFIGLFQPQLSRRGFVSLHVSLDNDGDVLLDELFTDAGEASAFLDGTLLEVGPIPSGANTFPIEPSRATLRIELVTSRPGAGLGLDFLVGTAPPAP